MSKLTDSQHVILSAAAARDTGAVLPLPKSCKLNQGAAAIVLKSLLKKNLIAEHPASAGDETWRHIKDGPRLKLVITNTGCEAVGVLPEEAPAAALEKTGTSSRTKAAKLSSQMMKPVPQAGPRAGSKQAALIDLLKRKSGATIEEAIVATGWQAHSVRGAISGTLKKKLGLHVTSTLIEGRGRVYQIVA